ncbi:macrophage mannose receptor 1-like [Pagrus major]|uniref:macrophage mannose receptor 1-like n=1 Tax=Pagrus major TaxID=143350 RepID=UPI003CC86C37
MKGCLSGPFLLLLITSSASGLGSVVWRYFIYNSNPYTWQDAQTYCRRHHDDLATIYTQADTYSMNMDGYDAWIGLYKQASNYSWTPNWYYWYWSNGNLNNLYTLWAENEPGDSESCAVVSSHNKRFYGTKCDASYFFICHEEKPNHFEHKFVPQSKTWSEAREYCKNHFDDLATFESRSGLEAFVTGRDYPVWIGLYRDGGTFKWSTGVSEYLNWASNEPGNNGDCVSISSADEKKMAVQDCSARFPFVCFRDNLVLVKENKTWEEALEHCRGLEPSSGSNPRYELLSVQPGDDHKYVMDKVRVAVTEKVWAGLRFLAGEWLWVNKADLLYSDLPLCPTMEQHCGALSKNYTGQMETIDCSEKFNFLCYRRW